MTFWHVEMSTQRFISRPVKGIHYKIIKNICIYIFLIEQVLRESREGDRAKNTES